MEVPAARDRDGLQAKGWLRLRRQGEGIQDLDRRLEQGYLPSIAALRAMLTLLEKPAGEPAAFYKDSNPRNFLLTGNGTIFTIDTDDLTLAPFGYDLAKLVATLTMTYGEIHPACIERALQIYNRAAAQRDARLGTTTLERLEEFLALHEVLNAPYAGRNGYLPPASALRNQRTRPAPRRARRPDRGIMTARITIIGMGHVGKAMHSLLCQQAEIVTYDAAWAVDYPARELAACDAGIICVDTPTGDGGACDATHVRDAVESLPAGAVLIKSTIPPGTTDLLASTTGKQVCFSPEYVGESTYHHPFWPGGDRDVPFMILGGGPPARRQFIDLLQPVLGPARTYFQCAAIEAEIIKYIENAYLATKVTFVSEFRRICEAFGADWHTVREGWLLDPRIEPTHTAAFASAPGFSGKCLPKDLAAMIRAAIDAGYHPHFLTEVHYSNQRFRSQDPCETEHAAGHRP